MGGGWRQVTRLGAPVTAQGSPAGVSGSLWTGSGDGGQESWQPWATHVLAARLVAEEARAGSLALRVWLGHCPGDQALGADAAGGHVKLTGVTRQNVVARVSDCPDPRARSPSGSCPR